MRRDEIWAIKEIVNSKIIDVLTALDVEFYERYQYVYGPCPIHGGDKIDGWSFHLELGTFQCYTRGCHNEVGKDIFALVMGIRDCSFIESINYLKKICDIVEIQTKEILERRKNKKFIDGVNSKNNKSIIYPEDSLKHLEYHNYLESRGFDRKIVEDFQIGIGKTPYKKMYNRIVFPIRDIEGNLVGFTGRDVTDKHIIGYRPKWIHSKNFDKVNNLFNIDRAHKFIKKTGNAIIVEGPIDVLRLEQAEIHNSVALLGRTLTNGHMSLLIKSGASKLLFALDDDQAGRTGTEQAIKISSMLFDTEKIVIGNKGDIGDLSVEEVRELFNEKDRIGLGRSLV